MKRVPKRQKTCDGCKADRPARYRALVDAFLCDPCYDDARREVASMPNRRTPVVTERPSEPEPEPEASEDLEGNWGVI